MRWLSIMRMRFVSLFRRAAAGAQLDEELQFHLQRQIAENVAAGMNPDEARYAALRMFGNPASHSSLWQPGAARCSITWWAT